MDVKKELIKILLESIDLKKLAAGLIEELLLEALEEYVAKTSNVVDDSVLVMLGPKLKEFALEFINKKIDDLLAKINE